MIQSSPPFFHELFRVPEIDCKDTENKSNKSGYSGIHILTQQSQENWSVEMKGMLEKIIQLCGFPLSDCFVSQLSHSYQISHSLHNPDTKYVICFCDKEITKRLHFRKKRTGWASFNNKKIYFNSSLAEFSKSTQAKKQFWKAIQTEFKTAREHTR